MVIEILRLTLALGGREVLKDVSLTLARGEVLGLLGPNGAGKSTLLRCISGELKAQQGEVRVLGRDLKEWSGRELAQRRAVMPQSQTLPFPFPCRTVVELGRYSHAEPADGPDGRRAVDDAMLRTDCAHLSAAPYTNLSGGEAQRVQMARALCQIADPGEAKLMLLDEPTASLDPKHQHASLALLRGLAAAGTASVCVLHDLNLAAAYCDRVALLADGRIHAIGSVDEVLTPALIAEVFGVQAEVLRRPGRRGPVIIINPRTEAGEHHESRTTMAGTR